MSQPAEDPLAGRHDGPDTLRALSALAETVAVSDTIRALHEEIFRRLREEAKAVPQFGTLQDMLLERAATQYALVRHREESDLTDSRVIKELNALFLSTVDTIYRQVRGNSDLAGLKEAAEEHVVEVLNRLLDEEDPDVRRRVLTRMADELDLTSA